MLTGTRVRRICRNKSRILRHNTILNRKPAFVWSREGSLRSRKVRNLPKGEAVRLCERSYVVPRGARATLGWDPWRLIAERRRKSVSVALHGHFLLAHRCGEGLDGTVCPLSLAHAEHGHLISPRHEAHELFPTHAGPALRAWRVASFRAESACPGRGRRHPRLLWSFLCPFPMALQRRRAPNRCRERVESHADGAHPDALGAPSASTSSSSSGQELVLIASGRER